MNQNVADTSLGEAIYHVYLSFKVWFRVQWRSRRGGAETFHLEICGDISGKMRRKKAKMENAEEMRKKGKGKEENEENIKKERSKIRNLRLKGLKKAEDLFFFSLSGND